MIIPEEILHQVQDALNSRERSREVVNFTPASGGCINNGGRVSTPDGDYFLKWNSATRFPGMFRAEAAGLKLLSDAKSFRIPEVIALGEAENYSWILMEHIKSSPRKPDYWKQLGKNLASLHRNTSEAYGLDHDNYIGSLGQKNGYLDNWIEFMISRRYEPMVSLALNSGKIGSEVAHNFEKLYGKLQGILVYEPPSLLHGDLWSGNLMIDDEGSPALIDPAVYYGNREIEIAFTILFSGFDKEFYDTYQQEWPLESGYTDRFELYNLYPLMVHVNLFGGSYLSQVNQVLKRFV